MKFLHPGLLFLFLAGQMLGENGFRKFTDIEGREIQARIHNTDGQRVMLETQDGQGFMTTVDVFSLNDQDYIRRWQPKPPEEAEGLEIDESEVEIRQEIYYQIGEQRPYSGVLVSKLVDDTPRATVGLKYGMQHGPTSLWYDSGGKMAQSMFLEGRQHGLTTFWYPAGEKKVESAYENGKQHGLTTFWYKNGQKRVEGLWNQGQRELVHTKWHENGEKMSEITYTWGRPNGSGAAWYENSEKRMEGNWKNGVKDGLYSEWHDNGQQKMEANYEDGVVKGKPLYWAENGKRLRKKPPEVVVDIDDDIIEVDESDNSAEVGVSVDYAWGLGWIDQARQNPVAVIGIILAMIILPIVGAVSMRGGMRTSVFEDDIFFDEEDEEYYDEDDDDDDDDWE